MGPEPFLSLLMWSWPGEESGLVPVPQQPLPREIFINCTGIVSFGSGWALRDRGDPQGSRRGPGLGPLGPTASLGMFHSTGLRGNNSYFVTAENEGEGREVPSETWIGMLILPEPQFGLAGEVSLLPGRLCSLRTASALGSFGKESGKGTEASLSEGHF